MKTKDVVQALAALAQETRLSIYRELVQAGPGGLAAGMLAERLKLANATLSFHLKELAHAGLITPHQEGRFIYYEAHYKAMTTLLAFLTENCCQGNVCGIDCAPTKLPSKKRKSA